MSNIIEVVEENTIVEVIEEKTIVELIEDVTDTVEVIITK